MSVFEKNIVRSLKVYDEQKSDAFLKDLDKRADDTCPLIRSEILESSDDHPVRNLIRSIFSVSPYLSQIILRSPATLEACLSHEPEDLLEIFIDRLDLNIQGATSQIEAMSFLRLFKREIALLIALADISGNRSVMQITGALTKAADSAVKHAVRYLLRQAAQKGEYLPVNMDIPEEGSGYFILAMGKHGAYELNYSSDIDLIVFYDLERIRLKEGVQPSVFFVKLTRDLVKLMQERTADGYVFRTDLRLRPDPGSTQVALSTDAGLIYYESMGQNWERAVYIKARPAVGDIEAAEDFLKQLSPFVWRKYLDFASIAEVHAMKRQIHAHKGHGEIAVSGHNIKLGRGGIREIEFFVQTQQLIAGGRQPELRSCATIETMNRLVEKNWVKRDVADELIESYNFLRHVEHRIQMVGDEQTHTLPTNQDALDRIALFSGFEDFSSFSDCLKMHLERVQKHYDELFEDLPDKQVNDSVAEIPVITSDTLSDMGFEDPAKVQSMLQNWHAGRYQSMRSNAARNRLREFQPVLLNALSKTASPDQAILSFDRFLANLPAGVQLFSLLKSNPNLLRLLADIMGTAPRLSQFLSRYSRVLDAVLDPGFFGDIPSDDVLEKIITKVISEARDYQDILDGVRSVGQEKAFLVGVRTLSGSITAEQSGYAYARLAELLISALTDCVTGALEDVHGKIEDGEAVVLAMGKLGGREMTASSDLDIIVIYDFNQDCIQSDGNKGLAPTQYFTRVTQRLISSLSAQTSFGNLYEVDMRLRPSGQSGPLATRLSSFDHYQKNDAWTWEHMALTRARVIAGSEGLRKRLETVISDVLTKERDPKKVAEDVIDMRSRITKDRGTSEHWHIKLVRGGLLDLEFITQYLQLVHAHKYPGILNQNTVDALTGISKAGLIDEETSRILIDAAQLYGRLTQILRLCVSDHFAPDEAPEGLKDLLCRTIGESSFEKLEERLKNTLNNVSDVYQQIIGPDSQ